MSLLLTSDSYNRYMVQPLMPIQNIKTDKEEKEETGQALSILLVEDTPLILKVNTMLLQSLNCKVDTAITGKEAVEKATSNSYDVIFMDIELPDFSGIEATKMIYEKNRHFTPIIALTTRVLDEIAKSCFEAGMYAIANKPITKGELSDLLKKVMFNYQNKRIVN